MVHVDAGSCGMPLLVQRAGLSFQIARNGGRSNSKRSSVPRAVVACMVDAREPSQAEIAAVATFIWFDWTGSTSDGGMELSRDSRAKRMMLAAARAALGCRPQEPPCACPASGEPAIWWTNGPRSVA